MTPHLQHALNVSRRHFLQECGIGVGKIALASLLTGTLTSRSAANPLAPKAPHIAPKAKRVIHLFMAGAPSQLDLFDYKPKLAQLEEEGNPEIATRIAAYEMAFRLQTSAPGLTDLRKESKATLERYGADPDKPTFARARLRARRMLERGVRFVKNYHEGCDAHSDVAGNLRKNCGDTDRASAALLHLLGFDHEKLTFHHAGRNFRLTDVHGHVVTDLLA
jgi:hypothetical protein